MMVKCVEFDEPWDEFADGGTMVAVIRLRADDVIRKQREREPRYKSDEQALDDFLTVHWARIVYVMESGDVYRLVSW